MEPPPQHRYAHVLARPQRGNVVCPHCDDRSGPVVWFHSDPENLDADLELCCEKPACLETVDLARCLKDAALRHVRSLAYETIRQRAPVRPDIDEDAEWHDTLRLCLRQHPLEAFLALVQEAYNEFIAQSAAVLASGSGAFLGLTMAHPDQVVDDLTRDMDVHAPRNYADLSAFLDTQWREANPEVSLKPAKR